MVRKLFKQEPEALADLRLLETGEIEPAEFERRFDPRLGVAETEGLIEDVRRGRARRGRDRGGAPRRATPGSAPG